jgi:CubicO group peptidase (beta-lactamase class C family)
MKLLTRRENWRVIKLQNATLNYPSQKPICRCVYFEMLKFTDIKKTVLLAVVLLLQANFQIVSANEDEKAVRELLEKNATWLLSHKEIHSTSIGIYKDGMSYTAHFGELDKGKGNTPNNDTLYEIASISKSFTGTLLAKAVLDGKLNLDDDVRKYLNEEFPNLEFNGVPLTIRHLATHTSGLPREFPDSSELWENPDENLPFKLEELAKDYNKTKFFADLHKVKITIKPGSEYAYSNAGPNLIAHILENVYKEDFERLLQENIFKKAGMTSTKLHLDKKETKRLANGYNEKGVLMPHYFNPLWGADGGYKSTLPDLMKYLEFQFSEENPVLMKGYEKLDGNDNSYQSYNWRINKLGDGSRRISAHGGAYGTQTWIAYYPKLKTGIVVITNESDQKTADKLISLLPWNSIYIDMLNKINAANVGEGIAFYENAKKNRQKDYDFSGIESQLNRMAYYLMRSDRIDEAIEIFNLNVSEFPKSANAYDSLAEAYFNKGNKKLSLLNYKKSLELDPKNDNAKAMIDKIEKEQKN